MFFIVFHYFCRELKDAYKDSQSHVLPSDAPNLLQAIHSFDSNVFQHHNASNFCQASNNTMTSSFQNHVPVQPQNVFNQNFQSANQPILNQQQSPVIKNYAHSQNHSSSSAHMDAFSQPSASSQMPNFMNQGVVSPNEAQYGGFENQMAMDQMFIQQQNVTNFQSTSNLLYQTPENNTNDWSSSQNTGQMPPHIDPIRELDFTNSPNQSVVIANDSLLSTSKSPLLSSTSAFQHNHQFSSQASQNHMVQNILANPHTSAINNTQTVVEGQKVVPRNNEYLQQQQQRPSPAQASTAPETSQINLQNQNKFVQKSSNSSSSVTGAAHQPVSHTQPKPAFTSNTNNNPHTNNLNLSIPRTNMLEALRNSSTLIQSLSDAKTTANSNDVSTPKPTPDDITKTAISKTIPIEDIAKIPLKIAVIKLDKINDEDQSLMQTDLKSFIQKDPQKAAKYGVAGPNNETLFTKMKEDEARLPYKRKLPTNNIRPEDVGKLLLLINLLI